MINRNSLIFFFTLSMLTFAHSDNTEIPPINFGGGLNVYNAPNDIGDNESPDMQNFVNALDGSSFKRNGSRRFITQAISSYPVTSLYRAYISSGSTFRRFLIATVGDKVVYSTDDVNPTWITVSSGLTPNQHWNFVTMNNKVIMTPEELQDDVKQFDLNASSFTNLFNLGVDAATGSVRLRGKYPLVSKNYFILANCVDVSSFGANVFISTAYNSRAYYSLLVQPSSMTQGRYLEIRTDDGEAITGAGELNGFVHFPKQTSISELSFGTLNLTLLGGDQTLTQRVTGFGVFAPRTFKSIGDAYIFGAKDGIRWWDGGQKSRLKVEEESRIISLKIKPIIDRCIKAGTWANARGFYYPKKQWYILSFEDPTYFPQGRNNRVMIYDLETAEWFPFSNWKIEGITSEDGIGDNGQLVFGDSNDGYVYLGDMDNAPNDARKELIIDPMESTTTWSGGSEDKFNFKEGTSSIKLSLIPTNNFLSSTTLMRVINIGEWPDKSEISKNDKFAFKVYITSVANVSSITVQLEVNDIKGNFDTNFTSVTIKSGALLVGNTTWANVEIALSSFPIRNDWTDLSTETISNANNLMIYGVRFVVTGVNVSSISIDDCRIVQSREASLNAYRYTKQFDFGTSAIKQFRQVLLNREVPNDSKFTIDVFTDFGKLTNQIPISGTFNKDLYVAAFNSTNSIQRLDPIDFSVKDSTISGSNTAFDFQYLTKDRDFIYAGDKANDRLVKISVDSMTNWVATFGSNGTGTGNFSNLQEISQDDDNLYIADVGNYRIKVHKKKDLSFVAQFGTLGLGATSYHVPTGVDVDDKYIYVGDEGNSVLKKVSKSSYTILLNQPLNINTVADISVRVDENYVYDCYNTQSELNYAFQDVVLEKRYKDNLKLASKTILRPLNNSTFQSTYTIQGDISLTDDYIIVVFTDDLSRKSNWYIQKLLKSDFSIVREYKTPKVLSTACATGISYKPKKKIDYQDLNSRGSYLQLKYSESDLDNTFKLYSQGFIIQNEGIQELR